MIITFNLHCYTYWGQNLFLHINGETVAMHYVADSQWQCSYNLTAKTEMVYDYFVQNPEQSHIVESPKTRILPATTTDLQVFEHEATTSKISEDQLFYCNQRGIPTEQAVGLIVNGYAKEVIKKLPMEFAVEAQKLLSVSLEGTVG